MKPEAVPPSLIRRFEAGEVPCDEPPGLTEIAYRAWKEAGGVPRREAEGPRDESGMPDPYDHGGEG